MKLPWFETHFRRVIIDMHIGDWDPRFLTKADAKQIVKELVKAKVNVAILYAKSHWGLAFYDTKYGHKHPQFERRDFFRELLEEAHENGIKVSCYYSVGWDIEVAKRNADWRQIDTEGNFLYFFKKWPQLCINSPYREYVKAQIRELTVNYDIDGFWLDIIRFHPKGCYCKYCNELFRDRFQTELPRDSSDPLWKNFHEWRMRVLEEFMMETRRMVKGIKPEVAITHNFIRTLESGEFAQSTEGITEADDYLSSEVHYFQLGTLGLTRDPKFCRAAGDGKPVELLFSRFTDGWDWSIKPLTSMKVESSFALAHNCSITFVDHCYPDGTVEPRFYDILREVYSYVEERERWVVGTKPVNYVAVHFSEKTRDLHPEKPEEYLLGFSGVCKALSEEHIPYEVITDRHITYETLKNFAAVVLSNSICLSDRQLDALKEYVEKGGGLVATYKTSLRDEYGNRREDFGLAEVFNVNLLDSINYKVTYVKVGDHAVTKSVHKTVPLPHPMDQLKVLISGDGEKAGSILYPFTENALPHRFVTHDLPPPGEDSGYPSIVASCNGGKVVYFACRPGAVYASSIPFPDYRRLLAGAVLYCARDRPPVEVEAPRCVEVTVLTDEEKEVVHLLNHQPELGRSLKIGGYRIPPVKFETAHVIEEVLPVYGIKAKIRVPKGREVSKVYLAPEKTSLDWQAKGDSILVEVPQVTIHTMVVVEFI